MCKNFNNENECVETCPPMKHYDSSTLQFVDNPNGKYAYGSYCVKKCPGKVNFIFPNTCR